MKTAAISIHSSTAAEAVAPATAKARMAAYLELTKPRITFLIVLTSAAGFCLGSIGTVNYLLFAHALIGIALLSSGIATLNQFMERDLDALMRRTADRPLPSGRLFPFEALWFGVTLTLMAEAYLALFVNVLTALLGLTVIAGYLFVYTPLKTRTSLSTALGAFPGAMPPLMGWTAARGEIDVAAWVLFAILFLWQFPHFLAIAWIYREDYGRAGIRMLPVLEPDGRVTGQQIIAYSVMLLPVSLLPAVLGLSGKIYLIAAFVLGLLFVASSVRAALSKSNQHARQLLLASVLYLPILFGVMVLPGRHLDLGDRPLHRVHHSDLPALADAGQIRGRAVDARRQVQVDQPDRDRLGRAVRDHLLAALHPGGGALQQHVQLVGVQLRTADHDHRGRRGFHRGAGWVGLGGLQVSRPCQRSARNLFARQQSSGSCLDHRDCDYLHQSRRNGPASLGPA